MQKTTTIVKMIIRVTGLIQLGVGLVTWPGKAYFLIPIHIFIVSILVVALLVLVTLAAQARVSTWLVLLGGAWALVLPAWGLTQTLFVPENVVWIIQVLHVLCGIGAVGVAEILGARMAKSSLQPGG
jgi:hypothetical protein